MKLTGNYPKSFLFQNNDLILFDFRTKQFLIGPHVHVKLLYFRVSTLNGIDVEIYKTKKIFL